MEVKTGKVKAIANLARQTDGTYYEDMNYAITKSEPGSTFKLVTMMSVLDDGYVKLNDPVDLEDGVWKVGTRTVYDSERHGRNVVTIQGKVGALQYLLFGVGITGLLSPRRFKPVNVSSLSLYR